MTDHPVEPTTVRRGPGLLRLWVLRILTGLRWQPQLTVETARVGPTPFRLVAVGRQADKGRPGTWVVYGYPTRCGAFRWSDPTLVHLEFVPGTICTVPEVRTP